MTRINESSRLFVGGCWAVVLPECWSAEVEEQGASFRRESGSGMLQVSSAMKEHAPVSDADLLEFATGKDVSEQDLHPIEHTKFRGRATTYVKDGHKYKEWWFRYSHVLV